ncbi:PAS domain-containing sensor histidine kinase [Arenibaculum sp.]|uniref:PAS domain-containing sensor histidine kinase n=1 Tax=Arenibaculum sp. TaxID=2865862 RepID=UPI002E0DD2FF|nr:PAS domain-containing protein [Arenibaculum sp.]
MPDLLRNGGILPALTDAAAHSARRAARLVEGLPVAAAIVGAARWKLLAANRSFASLMGFGAGREFLDLVDADGAEALAGLFAGVMDTGAEGRLDGTLRARTSGPGRPWLDIRASRIALGRRRDEAALLVVVLDATERVEALRAAEEARCALRDGEARLHATLDAARAVTWIWDSSTHGVHRSPNAAAILGVPPESLLDGRLLSASCALPEDAPTIDRAMRGAIEQGRNFDVEFRLRRPDGTIAWFSDRGHATVSATGAMCVGGIMVDITDRKRIEAALRRSEERLRLALDATGFGIWDWDLQSGSLTWSEQTCAILGLPPPSGIVPSMDILRSLVHPVDLDRFDAAMTAVLEPAAGPLEIEHRVMRPDGRTVWVAVRGRAVHSDDRSRAVRLVGTIRDVSLDRTIGAALRESEARLRQLADAMPQIVWSADADCVMDYCNRKWFDFVGDEAPEEGEEIEWLAHVHPDDIGRVRLAWRQSALTGTGCDIEFRLRSSAGVWRWHLGRGLPVLERDGTVARWYGTFTDIHEQKNIEGALSALLAEKDNLLGRARMLMREVDHRVKNSLGLISSLLLMQASEATDPAVRAQLVEANNRVLTVAQVHQRLYQTDRLDRIDFAPYLDGLCEDLDRSLGCTQKGLSLVVDAEPAELPTDRIVQLALVVNELVTNAAKYSHPEGGPGTIRIRFRIDEAGNQVLTVADDGIGFPPEFAPSRSGTLGMKLLVALADGLDGRIELGNGRPGARITMVLPDLDRQPLGAPSS